MNPNTYKTWLSYAVNPNFAWCRDQVTWMNRGELLLSRGNHDGAYITIDRTGMARAGMYHGAIPHIGDALFSAPFYTKQFESLDAAVNGIALSLSKKVSGTTTLTVENEVYHFMMACGRSRSMSNPTFRLGQKVKATDPLLGDFEGNIIEIETNGASVVYWVADRTGMHVDLRADQLK